MSAAVGSPERERALCDSISAKVPKEVLTISRVLAGEGHRVWLVGGSVRDLIRTWAGHPGARLPADFDLCTDAKPEVVVGLFRRVIPTGIAHGTVTIVLGGRHFEVTTLRGERGYSDGRRPDEVFFVNDLTLDLARRDFTVNAIAFDVENPALIDPFGGREDLDRGMLRAVGDPLERFSEDGLRVLRCARFASTLGLDVEALTRAAMRPSLGSFAKVAAERVREEWIKALSSPTPSRAFRLLRSEGLLAITCPELYPEGLPAADGAYDTACDLLDQADADPMLRLALLLVRAVAVVPADELTPPAPSARALMLASRLALQLKLSGAEKTRLSRLAEPTADLLYGAAEVPDAPSLRRLMRKIGSEYLDDVGRLSLLVSEPASEAEGRLRGIQRRMVEEAARSPVLSLRDLALTGAEIISGLGMPPGPEVGRMLERLLEAALDDPAVNDKERLLSLARQLK